MKGEGETEKEDLHPLVYLQPPVQARLAGPKPGTRNSISVSQVQAGMQPLGHGLLPRGDSRKLNQRHRAAGTQMGGSDLRCGDSSSSVIHCSTEPLQLMLIRTCWIFQSHKNLSSHSKTEFLFIGKHMNGLKI